MREKMAASHEHSSYRTNKQINNCLNALGETRPVSPDPGTLLPGTEVLRSLCYGVNYTINSIQVHSAIYEKMYMQRKRRHLNLQSASIY